MSTATVYAEHLKKLLPRGKAWQIENDSFFHGLLKGLAVELARVHARILDLLNESDPTTAVELLSEWEKEYGLPDECSVIADNVPQRRLDLRSRILAVGGQSAAYFQSLFDNGNVTIDGTPRGVVYAGSPVGVPLRGPVYRNVWYVNIPDSNIEYFESGDSTGEPLVEAFDPTNAMCLILKNKPAHTLVVFTFNP